MRNPGSTEENDCYAFGASPEQAIANYAMKRSQD